MIILIGGSSHTGKTNLSQRLMEKYGYPYVSIDHIKMGLIRSGYTDISVYEDERLTAYLWPVVREMIKTAIENGQHMIIEGCYIPYDWRDSFEKDYLDNIRYVCLIMTEEYIENHFNDIKRHASVIENRGEDEDCTKEWLLAENKNCYEMCRRYDCDYILIEDAYDVDEMVRLAAGEKELG